MSQQRRSGATLVLVALAFLTTSSLGQSGWQQTYESEAAGDYPGAMRALEPIIESQPNNEFLVLRSAWLKYLNGDYNASLRDYRRALELNEQSLDAMLGITLPLLAQRRWREAAAQAHQALTVAPYNYYGHVRLMVAEEGLQQWRTLADHATEMTMRFPSDATFFVYLARARAWQGNVAAARAAYGHVLERAPGHEEAAAYIRGNR
jgi:tetratricopeptide (TPR) repeat protein